METKYTRLKEGVLTSFIDPDGYKKYVAQKERVVRANLAKQKAGAVP